MLGPIWVAIFFLRPMLSNTDFDKIFRGPLLQTQSEAAIMPPPHAAAERAGQEPEQGSLSLMSWNLLATPYVRRRSTETEQEGLRRAQQQISYTTAHLPDVVGLQEFYMSPRFVTLWRDFASRHGYIMHLCPRVHGKADGCCMLVRATCCAVPPTFSTYTFDDWGHRVLQSCSLQLASARQPLVLMQTHLTFPHDNDWDPVMRRHQARKAAELVRQQHGATAVFGDLNAADDKDEALMLLTTLGGLASLPASADGERRRWISHVAHTGAHMACDLVLTRACRVERWHLGGSHEELVGGTLSSDHRPLHAILQLAMPSTESEEGGVMF